MKIWIVAGAIGLFVGQEEAKPIGFEWQVEVKDEATSEIIKTFKTRDVLNFKVSNAGCTLDLAGPTGEELRDQIAGLTCTVSAKGSFLAATHGQLCDLRRAEEDGAVDLTIGWRDDGGRHDYEIRAKCLNK